MPEIKIVACDICHTPKKETNHWWRLLANLRLRSTFSYPYDGEAGGRIYEEGYQELFLCGLEHLMLAESRIRNGKDPITGR